MRALFDSDVLIDFLRGVDAAATEIARYDDACYSVISWMEVMAGAETDEERFAAEALFESMRRIDLTAEVARRAVDLRRALRVKLPDAIVLASADREGCILVTRNTKDFDRDDPRIRVPYGG
ncbi:MAG: type II toxin-antitoxin system VapC family toxin [Planctomycetes bacterium]|nr:type II toxin-antitoxin system VapC family toxin [Planctomycetota bacterium]MBM4057938.1 type II toxin-antitoxin system VapC family toxin [Planctomycetota bacterium]